MPATTNNKTESKACTDLGDAAKQCLNGLEKKVRNLEKRKGRIEQNQEKARKGVKLEKEQEDSLQQYDQVMHCLEFARELHKQFLQINQEHEKVARKQAKREKAERQALEIKRICEILQLQALLDLLGRDNVREDFKTGKHGAVVLTEDNLNQLDELYQAISPSRDDSGDEYPQRITLAAEHLVNYLDAKDRQVVGTTYKQLKELITLIMQCGYFEKPTNVELLEAASTEAGVETDVAAAEAEEAVGDELASSHEPDLTLDEPQHQQPPVDLTTAVAEVTQSHRVLSTPALNTLEQDAFFAPSSLPYQSTTDPHFTQSSLAAAPHIPDYPSFSNGPFQFIQASYVMPDTAGISDPAVIVAQPAVSSGLQFMSQRYDSQPHGAPQMQQLPSQQQQNQTVGSLGDLTQSTASQQSQQLAQDYSSQSYAQNMQTDSLFTVQGVGDVADKLSSHPSILAQMREDSAKSAFEIPPSIPLPPSQIQSEASSEQQQMQETQFQMNARAPVFQSMYSQMAGGAVVSSVAVSQASVLAGCEGQIPTSAVDFSKSSPTGEFGQPGAGDFQQSSKGGTYQGYPPSNNYRPDSFQGGAYNNYNKNRYSGDGYQKRGAALGSPGGRGFSRGGPGVNNVRGGMRGGVARGGNTGSRGGYNRPLATQ
ncbi:hypothetical protein BsWGS_18963 [Bradybaena similaris]